MLRLGISQKLDPALRWISVSVAAVSPSVAASLEVDASRWGQPLKAYLEFSKANAWWLLLALALLAIGVEAFRSYIGSRDSWRLVQLILERIHKEFFGRNPVGTEDPEHFHRVTLFRLVKRYWWKRFRSQWLVLVARSGSTRRSAIAVFRAPLSAPSGIRPGGRRGGRSALAGQVPLRPEWARGL